MEEKLSQSEEAVQLIDELLPFAEKMLEENREFFPFGAHITTEGETVWDGAANGEERPRSQDLISLLQERYRVMASQGSIRACVVLYDILTIPPGASDKQDAICAVADSSDGYSERFVFPYSFDASGELIVEAGYVAGDGAGTFSPNA